MMVRHYPPVHDFITLMITGLTATARYLLGVS